MTKYSTPHNTRDKLVRDLTQQECRDLLVHSHVITPERRRALRFVGGPAAAYFKPEEFEPMRQWIANETYLPQDCREFEHPKLPTHWCDYHGHVVECECDTKREERSRAKREQSQLKRLQKQRDSLRQAAHGILALLDAMEEEIAPEDQRDPVR